MRISTNFAAHSGTTRAIEQLNVEPHPPRQSHTCMVWGLFKGGVYFKYGMHQIHVHVLQNKGYGGNLSTLHVPRYSMYGLKFHCKDMGVNYM